MDERFEAWMIASGTDTATTRSYLSNLRRVETAYGDLDALYTEDGYVSLIADLSYTSGDARQGLPNNSRIVISGDVYNGLATLRSCVAKYRRFRDEVAWAAAPVDVDAAVPISVDPIPVGAERELTFSMERDLQAALRQSIDQLEPGLTIIDGGAEHRRAVRHDRHLGQGRRRGARRDRAQGGSGNPRCGRAGARLHG